jgi:hypothetical protein
VNAHRFSFWHADDNNACFPHPMPCLGKLRLELKPLIWRLLIWAVLIIASAGVVFLSISYIAIPLHILLSPRLYPSLYELGLYGGSPSQTYISNGLTSPRVSIRQHSENCDPGYTFLNFNGDSVPQHGPAILDSANELVWKAEHYGTTTNHKVQSYRGEQFLTFWAGAKGGTMGQGVYIMVSGFPRRTSYLELTTSPKLDSTYTEKHTVSGVGVSGDLHEFVVTKDNTALLTFYNVTPADLSPLGKWKNGWLIDSGFQEVDIATGKLLFEWRASDHFQVNETFMTHPFGGYIKSMPFDFYHINSVDKDSRGNYLVSSRHTHSVSCVGPDGQIKWILGGQRNQFTDLSAGDALGFRWQHDARWVDEEKGILSLFDNKEGGPLHVDGPFSQGLMLQLDVANRTVQLLHSYVSLHKTRSPSQGSAQYLPESDHMFVAYGHSPVLSEFTLDGTLLCEVHYGAPWLHAFNVAVSYRAFKSSNWIGRPLEPPAAKIEDDNLYVSWNGATEVVAWVLQGAGEDHGGFADLDVVDKDAYEVFFELDNLSQYSWFRVAALDRTGKVLGHSAVVQRPPSASWWKWLLVAFCFGVLSRFGWMGYRNSMLRRKAGKKGVSWVVWRKE